MADFQFCNKCRSLEFFNENNDCTRCEFFDQDTDI